MGQLHASVLACGRAPCFPTGWAVNHYIQSCGGFHKAGPHKLQVTTGATLLLSEHSASVTWFMLGSHSITAGQASPPCLRALGSSVELFAWLSWEQLICSEQFGSLQVSIISDCFPWLALRWSALCVYRYCTFTYVFMQSLQINIHTGYIREKVFNHGICCEQVGAVGNPINLGFWFCFLASEPFCGDNFIN